MSYLPLTHPPRSLGFFICKMVTMFTSWLAAKINDPLHDRAPRVLPGMVRPSTNSKRRERKKIQNSVCILPYSGAVLLCTAEH